MSEYQYYEFQAIDRPLTANQQATLRRHSSRAEITATRFVNHYDYGDFRGNADAWMAKYFDAFVYVASWGTRELMLRLPRRALDAGVARQYAGSRCVVRAAGSSIVIALRSAEESEASWDDDGRGWMASLVALRADLAAGDHRALYLAWLAGVGDDDLDGDALEPPVPPGLSTLSASLQALVELLEIDETLLATAARASARLPGASKRGLERWIAALSEREKTRLLVRTTAGDAIGAELLGRFRRTQRVVAPAPRRRTVAALLGGPRRRAAGAAAARER